MKWGGGLLALIVALAAACSDDPKNNNGNNQDSPNNDEPDVVMMDADDEDGADDVTEDEPMREPENDQERILFIPETESWVLPGLEGEAHVVRTELNVPHVYASNRNDMARVLGFVVARDRFFVMDLQRRLAQGQLSALLGDLALDIDIENRVLGMDFVTQLVLDNLSEEDAAYMDAYAEGINAYIDAVEREELPPPSEVLLVSPLFDREPTEMMDRFDRRDLAAMVAVIMYQTNFESGDIGREAKYLQFQELFAGSDVPFGDLRRAGALEDIYDNLTPPYEVSTSPDWSGSIDDSGTGSEVIRRGPLGTDRRLNVEKSMLQRSAARMEQFKIRMGRREADNFGSNTWAVHGDHTTDGFSLVAGDGHLPLYVPSIMYQVGMNTSLFGDGDIHQAGLLITSLPVLAVGTNGDIAWSQVNPVADIVDWYTEEIILDDQGAPQASVFQGEDRPLVAFEETTVVANVDFLDSVGRSVEWTRWTTFDGRFIYDIEGTPVAEDEEPPGTGTVVFLPSGRVVPGDVDGDGKVTALSFDTTAFDTSKYISALVGFSRATDVTDYQEYSKGLIGNMLYAAVSDKDGDILFSPYQAVPCRSYLPRSEEGRFVHGADPTMLIDGTQYGGFTIPSNEDGTVDESQGEEDPYRCVVPFAETPQVVNPDQGFVMNANNQPAPIQNDGKIDNDPWYIGGPWSAVRADSIAGGLEAQVADNSASVEGMAQIQADTRSRLGELFTQHLINAITTARGFADSDGDLEPHQERLANLYNERAPRYDEVAQRLEGWIERGYRTPPGVDTFYMPLEANDPDDAVATMIFNAWLPRAINAVFNDENMESAFRFSRSRMSFAALRRFLDGRSLDDANGVASWNAETGESIFFDVLDTPEVERSDEILVMAMGQALDFLESEPTGAGEGGFGTEDMQEWLWGLRHQVRFESLLADFLPPGSSFGFLTDLFSITTRQLPLADDIPAGDPRRGLKWFPRPGDNFAVDAANPGFSGTRFTHGSGPVMRMVIALKDGEVYGQNIVPGGQSGLNDSPHFSDQAAMWLGNDTVPLLYHHADIAAGALGRESFKSSE